MFVRKNFQHRELACKCCGALVHNERALDALQLMRDLYGEPMAITSGYRCQKHNAAVGGSLLSYHTQGRAFDIRYSSAGQLAPLHDAARRAGFDGIGVYRSFIHVDTGARRMWHG